MQAVVNLEEYKDCGIAPADHYIGLVTQGVAARAGEDVEILRAAFDATKKGDWFYPITLGALKVFIAHNGEMGYTMMLPEEY